MASPQPPSVDWLIDHFGLEPLAVEGGRYAETWRSHRHWPGNDKPAGTAILFLLTATPDGFSAWHRLPADEVWHRYLGDPARLVLLHPEGAREHSNREAGARQDIVLGDDLAGGQQVQVVVPAGAWMACYVPAGGPCGYTLVGCTMAPGFTKEDYEGAAPAELRRAHPEAGELIQQLSRPQQPLRMPANY